MSFAVKGWCPSAHRPMMSGDGLLVRIKPRLGQVSLDDALALCDLATRFGNGIIDLTSRANFQIRGVKESGYGDLLSALVACGLVAEDPVVEARMNVILTPFALADDLTSRIAQSYIDRASELPMLPDKMGVAVDAGDDRALWDASADFRFETDEAGGLILRADGASGGRAISEADAIDALIEMAQWFVTTGGAVHDRMARHLQHATLPLEWTTTPPDDLQVFPVIGPAIGGHFVGVPFGQMHATDLRALLQEAEPAAIRPTTRRALFLERGRRPSHPAFLHTPDPILDVAACPGSPACAQAAGPTRGIARAVAAKHGGTIHVSGCAKGCARRSSAAWTIVACSDGYDVIRDGHPWDTPMARGLSEPELLRLFDEH